MGIFKSKRQVVAPSFKGSGAVLTAGTMPESALTAASAVGIGVLRVAHAQYDFSVDGGVQGTITPVLTAQIPSGALIIGGQSYAKGAVTSLGSATVAIGTSAGSSSSSLLAATAKASLGANAALNAVPTFAAAVRMSAAGNITFTIATADLTAGVIDAWVLYLLPH